MTHAIATEHEAGIYSDGYQAGITAAAAALAVMVDSAHTPEQTARDVRDWLRSHGQEWDPAKHGFPGGGGN
jgi:hypothetical protein